MTDAEKIQQIRVIVERYRAGGFVSHAAMMEIRSILNQAEKVERHPDWPKVHREYKITFDGGTPCNNPKIGYGIGYGSFSINDSAPIRINHGKPMSANAAEIMTLICAIRRVSELERNPQIIALNIWGDSQIAINWANGSTPSGKAKRMSAKTSEEFRNCVQTLRDILRSYAKVEARWHPRIESVRAFGH